MAYVTSRNYVMLPELLGAFGGGSPSNTRGGPNPQASPQLRPCDPRKHTYWRKMIGLYVMVSLELITFLVTFDLDLTLRGIFVLAYKTSFCCLKLMACLKFVLSTARCLIIII